MALDLCDLEWGRHRTNQAPLVLRTAEWVLMTEFSVPQPDRFVRTMTTFIHQKDGSWRRDDECHHNVLIDTSRLPELLAHHGVEATVSNSFGGAELPSGLVAVVGRKIIEPLGGRR